LRSVGRGIFVRQAGLPDARLIASDIRDEDRDEILRLGYGSVPDMLALSIDRSAMCGTWFHQDRPIALFGIVPISVATDTASPWLIGTNELSRCKASFLRETQRWIAEWRRQYSVLSNHVDAEYAQSIRWLKRSGFTVYPPEPYGALGKPFCRFEMRS